MGTRGLVILGLITGGLTGQTLSANPEPPLSSVPSAASRDKIDDPNLPETDLESWMVQSRWKAIRPRMTASRVEALLGSPRAQEDLGPICTWYYQDIPVQLSGGAVQRPRCGAVIFKKPPSSEGSDLAVKSWKEPNWAQTPPVTDGEYRAAQRQQAQARRAAQLEQFRRQQARLAEEHREALRRRQVATIPQPAPLSSNPSPAPPEKNRDPIFFAAGGVLGVLVFAAWLLRGPFRR